MNHIHKTAIIGDSTIIAEDVEVGPYAVIGEGVSIGSGTKIGAHAIIGERTKIGQDCQIFPGASIGLAPQSITYKNEATSVHIGNRVTVREYVTIHRGTAEETAGTNGEARGITVVGDDCFLMNYAHIAHDCKLGKGVIMANSATLAGHVQVGDFSVMAGVCVFHQFVRIGRMCMVSGMTGSRMDLPPFVMLDGLPPMIRGVNVVGMRRQKLSSEVRSSVKNAYKLLYQSGLNFSQAIAQLKDENNIASEVQEIIDFFVSSKRGVIGAYKEDESKQSTIREATAHELLSEP
jgi:UDP-N-acetylglucosamine acyltransferase